MDSEAPAKQSVRLSIFNQQFSLLVSGDPTEMEQAAHEVDHLMSTIARSGNMDAARVAILACLHLQDRLHTLQKDLLQFKNQVDNKGRHLAFLLDEVIASAEPAQSLDLRPELAEDIGISHPQLPGFRSENS